MRHALGLYRALIITGLYTVQIRPGDEDVDMSDSSLYIPALKWCIAAHPILSAAIQEEGSEAPEFVRPAKLDLRKHIQVIDTTSPDYMLAGDELGLLKRITLEIHDHTFPDVEKVPPWKIVVLPLLDEAVGMKKRAYIIFAYSHSHGDGRSGLNFHRTLLEGLQAPRQDYDREPIYQPPSSPLPPPLEETCNMKISWSYFLFVLFGDYMPNFVRQRLNLPAKTARPWIGKPVYYNADNFHTGSQILIVNNDLLREVLTACRARGTKMTGLLNQLVVRSLSEALPAENESDSFIGQIVVDLRALVPAYSSNQMLNCVSAANQTNPRPCKKSEQGEVCSLSRDEDVWDAARKTTTWLADCASTLDDHSIGLLRYVNDFRTWYLDKLGKPRDSSYEISNLTIFDPSSPNSLTNASERGEGSSWDIERIVFSQPAIATGCPLTFQVATKKGGDMVITLNWQLGILDVPDEDVFTQAVLRKVHGFLTAIASETR